MSNTHQVNNLSSNNRKLTPSKGQTLVPQPISATSNFQGINTLTSTSKNLYDKSRAKIQTHPRGPQTDGRIDNSRKNIRKKDRAGTSLDNEQNDPSLADGQIILGPGGRPKTSLGKHSLHNNGVSMIQNGNTNSRLSHYSAGQKPIGSIPKSNTNATY
jgi:hypothetical protein